MKRVKINDKGKKQANRSIKLNNYQFRFEIKERFNLFLKSKSSNQ